LATSNTISGGMRLGLLKAGMVVAALAGWLALPVTAAATPTGATFPGGSLTGLVVDEGAFTRGSFENLAYTYDGCGTQPAEATCTWEVTVTLSSDPAGRCSPASTESQVVWSSGTRAGNGSVESGPLSFALEGCRGQVLAGFLTTAKTFDIDEQSGPWIIVGNGGRQSLFAIGIGAESVKEAEERIIAASPPAESTAPEPPPRLMVSADCRSLMIGRTRYAFVFRRIGCHKATNIARIALWGSRPSGYRCVDKRGGGKRCIRQGNPKKYLEWRLPADRPRPGPSR
jgi:hypothetical protein